MSRNIIPGFPEKQQWQAFGWLSSAMSSRSFKVSIYQSHMCVLCRECNSIMNHDPLPGCTVLQSQDSTNCKIILGLQKVNAYHLSAWLLNTTTTNKNCCALKIKVCWVMKHQLQVIITGCIITSIQGMWESQWKYSATITLYCLQHTWFLEHSRYYTCSTLLS